MIEKINRTKNFRNKLYLLTLKGMLNFNLYFETLYYCRKNFFYIKLFESLNYIKFVQTFEISGYVTTRQEKQTDNEHKKAKSQSSLE